MLYIGHGIVIKSDHKGRYLWVKEVPARLIFLRTRLSPVPGKRVEIGVTAGRAYNSEQLEGAVHGAQ